METVTDMFDDFDAEDAYDADDPVEDRVRVLGRVADEVGATPATEIDRKRRRWAIGLILVLRDRLDELDDELSAIERQLGGV